MCSCMERYRFSCHCNWRHHHILGKRGGVQKRGRAVCGASKSTHAHAAFATIGSILILEWTNNLVVLIRCGKRALERGSRWHHRRWRMSSLAGPSPAAQTRGSSKLRAPREVKVGRARVTVGDICMQAGNNGGQSIDAGDAS